MTEAIYLRVGQDFKHLVLPTFTDPNAGDSHTLTLAALDVVYLDFTTIMDFMTHLEALIQPTESS